jgi:transcriptional regulator with XRE-family HTH domain
VTPGTYLRTRREAAGVSLDQLLEKIGTVPRIPEHDRRSWLVAIENDTVRPDEFAIVALRDCFKFDVSVLQQLLDIHHFAAALPAPRICRVCGCSNQDPCRWNHTTCGWAEYDLCTVCEFFGGDGPLADAAAMLIAPAIDDQHAKRAA